MPDDPIVSLTFDGVIHKQVTSNQCYVIEKYRTNWQKRFAVNCSYQLFGKVHSKVGSESTIIWGMLFGVIGVGFFMYGKKQRAVVPLFTGVALFVLPYFVRI